MTEFRRELGLSNETRKTLREDFFDCYNSIHRRRLSPDYQSVKTTRDIEIGERVINADISLNDGSFAADISSKTLRLDVDGMLHQDRTKYLPGRGWEFDDGRPTFSEAAFSRLDRIFPDNPELKTILAKHSDDKNYAMFDDLELFNAAAQLLPENSKTITRAHLYRSNDLTLGGGYRGKDGERVDDCDYISDVRFEIGKYTNAQRQLGKFSCRAALSRDDHTPLYIENLLVTTPTDTRLQLMLEGDSDDIKSYSASKSADDITAQTIQNMKRMIENDS